MCEGRKVNLKTGNLVVDAVGKMNFVGNVIPENWFKTIVTASGKVHLLAILSCQKSYTGTSPPKSATKEQAM